MPATRRRTTTTTTTMIIIVVELLSSKSLDPKHLSDASDFVGANSLRSYPLYESNI